MHVIACCSVRSREGEPRVYLDIVLVPQSCLTLHNPHGQAPLSMEYFKQEYWSGLQFASPGYFPDPGIKPCSPALQADSLLSEPPGKPIFGYS